MDSFSKPASSVLGPLAPDREMHCETHGPFASRNLFRSIWTKCPTCESLATAAREAENAEKELAASAARYRGLIDAAGIPARFERCSFDNFIAETDQQRHALTVARDFVEGFSENSKRGAALIFSGLPGTGKSHLAGAILRSLMPLHVRYMTCMDVIRSIRGTWRKDSEQSESQVLTYLEKLNLLVIDEIGMQYGTDGEQTIIFDVLDRRYREMRPLVLLTNQGREGFKDYVGERTYDRLRETSRWVAFDWPSYRAKARKDAA